MHFAKILVTTDFSEDSCAAFELAAYDKKLDGTEIRLLHVIQNLPLPLETGELPPPPAERQDPLQSRAETMLKMLAKDYFHNQRISTDVILSVESPASAICQYAKENGFELIIMASRGWSRVQGLIFGSTVQGVLNRATCPVMVIPVRNDLSYL